MTGSTVVSEDVRRLADVCLFPGIPGEEASTDLVLSPDAEQVLRQLSGGKPGAATAVLSAALGVLLHRYRGDGPVTIDFSGRQLATAEIQLEPRQTFRELLTQCSRRLAEASAGTAAGSAEILLTVGSSIATTAWSAETYDLAVHLRFPDCPALRLESPSGALPRWFLADLAARLEDLLGLFDDPDQPATVFDALLGTRIASVTERFNRTERTIPDVTVLDLFAGRVRSAPDTTAVIGSSKSLSYAELDAAARCLAHTLRNRLGISAGDVVAVRPARDHEAVVALLGVLTAGAVFLPLHRDWPENRVRRILADAGAKALLVPSGEPATDPPVPGLPVLPLCPRADVRPGSLPDRARPRPDDPAYVVFTSGTTGQPKGVLVGHRGLANTTLDHIDRFAMTSGDTYLQFMALSFDGFLLDTFSALCSGAALVIAGEEAIEDPGLLTALLDRHAVTVSTMTPSYLRLLDRDRLAKVRVLVSAGEVLDKDLALGLARHTALYNGYGPTEATVNTTLHRVDPDRPADPVPIGKPSANKKVYVVDEELREQPIGVLGEICVSGAGLAFGYLNDPQLTEQKFVASPFPGSPRLYRTGDYGAWTPDGQLLFRGRSDRQVKVNGYRVDLSEIEQVLHAHPGVGECRAVLRSGHGRNEIAAFYTGSRVDPAALRQHLASGLAEYACPRHLVEIGQWPLTAHGKTDVAALLRSTAAGPQRGAAATTPTEHRLNAVWRAVLGRETIDTDASFHSQGGDSLRLIEVVLRARDDGLDFAATDVLREGTLRNLARWLDDRPAAVRQVAVPPRRAALTSQETAALPPGVSDAYPAAAMQSLMIEHYAADVTDTGIYLGCAEWKFTDDTLDEDALCEAIQRLWASHPVLRTTFRRASGRDLVLIAPPGPLRIDRADLRPAARPELDDWFRSEIRREAGRRFNPFSGEPLVRFRLCRTGPDACSIFFSFHHALLDGWSGIELRNALWAHYLDAKLARPMADAAAQPNVYREFVALEQEIRNSEDARAFWRGWLDTDAARTALKATRHRFASAGPASRTTIEQDFGPEATAEAIRYGERCGVSTKTVFLSAVCRAMREVFALPSSAIAMVVNGRSELLTVPLRSTGLFWNVVPFITNTADATDTAASASVARLQQRLDAMTPFQAFPLQDLERELPGGPLIAPIFNFVNFHNAGEGAHRFAEGVVQSRFHFPLTFFVKLSGSGAAVSARLRIDADDAVLAPVRAERLGDSVRAALTATTRGNDDQHSPARNLH